MEFGSFFDDVVLDVGPGLGFVVGEFGWDGDLFDVVFDVGLSVWAFVGCGVGGSVGSLADGDEAVGFGYVYVAVVGDVGLVAVVVDGAVCGLGVFEWGAGLLGEVGVVGDDLIVDGVLFGSADWVLDDCDEFGDVGVGDVGDVVWRGL